MNRYTCLFLTALVCPGLANAEEPRPVRPLPVNVPDVGGNGHAETWDGRVFVITRGLPGGQVGWAARVLRPERISLDAEGRPRFVRGAFSPVFPFQRRADAGAAGLTDINALAIAPTPSVLKNPYPSNAGGAAIAGGAYETYDLLVFTQHYQAGDDRMGRLRYRLTIKAPRTRDAEVERVVRVSAFEQLTQANGQPLRGIEPTLTFDGRLLVWQGHPANDSRIDTLIYSLNQTRGAVGGWSAPKSLADMYHVDRAKLVAGLRFDERYPLAQEPLWANDGRAYGAGRLFTGAYPWISRDGSELFFTSTVAGVAGVNRARRGGQAVIGRLTGWVMRHLDGPLNPDREATVRLFTSSPGLTPGMWTPFRGTTQPLPAGAGRPVYPLFGSNTHNYADVNLSDAADGEHALVLRMNEVVTQDGVIDARHTPDTSGAARVGRLEGGASFPQELGMPDASVGYVGQAIYFPQGGSVRAPKVTVRDDLTVSLWVKRLVSLGGDPGNRYLLLANQPGAWQLVVEEDGRIQASVRSGGAERRSGALGPGLAVDQWTHVAFTYSAGEGRLRVWQDGLPVGERVFGAGRIETSSSELIVGPGGQLPLAPGVSANRPVLLLDEFVVSRVVRSAREVAAAAYRTTPAAPAGPALGAVLPLGIPASALRVPPGAATSNAAAALGELLFFEKRISRDGSVSCASCHRPALGFTDGLARARGVGGALGARNTPTVLNRALSSAQFFDGRASSLEVQALGPIENPDEMNLPIPDAVARLATSATYRARFRAAFGRGPSRATLAAALAAFQRRLLSGGSRVDRWEAGQGGLTPREVRGRELFLGRARCVACHVGPNFTDEAFHNTASARSLSDRGRAAATGRASDEGRFKTPTLRDVSRTAPYLHDGSVGTLEEVIELYDRGGLRRSGRDVEIRALGLTPGEKADLAAFLRALDGPSTARQPPSLPTDVQFTAPLATPTEQWLDSVYQAYLGRVATGAERTDQVRALSAGRTPEQVVREVSTSPGALERKVEGLYRRYLNRLGDPGGVANYVAAAQSGRQRAALEVDFLLSAENRARRPGQVGWITGLYEDVLGRAPDAAGLAGHDAHLTANPNSRDSVARAFVRSGERHGRWVDAAYTDLLSRAPSASERADAVARLGQGEALEEVRVRLLTSLAP